MSFDRIRVTPHGSRFHRPFLPGPSLPLSLCLAYERPARSSQRLWTNNTPRIIVLACSLLIHYSRGVIIAHDESLVVEEQVHMVV